MEFVSPCKWNLVKHVQHEKENLYVFRCFNCDLIVGSREEHPDFSTECGKDEHERLYLRL